jgi:hypothetical protein
MTLPKSAASKQVTFADRLAHGGRMVGFFLTAGFAYPNVFVEGLNLTKLDAKTKADAAKL